MENLLGQRFGLFEIVGRRSPIDPIFLIRHQLSTRIHSILENLKSNKQTKISEENSLFFLLLIGRKQSFDLNVQRCWGLVLVELEIRSGGIGHFQFAILIDGSRLLHEENLLSSKILLDQIDVVMNRQRERERLSFVRSALVNGGREITWRSSSARKTNSGWFSSKVRYLLDRRSIKRNFFSPVKNALLESGDVISFFNFLCCSASRANCSSNSCAETLFSGFPSGTSAIWFGSLAS